MAARLPCSIDDCKTITERGRWLHAHNPDAYAHSEPYWVTGAKHEMRLLDPVDRVAYARELLRWARDRI